jgi:hypothetical protein
MVLHNTLSPGVSIKFLGTSNKNSFALDGCCTYTIFNLLTPQNNIFSSNIVRELVRHCCQKYQSRYQSQIDKLAHGIDNIDQQLVVRGQVLIVCVLPDKIQSQSSRPTAFAINARMPKKTGTNRIATAVIHTCLLSWFLP